MEENLPTKQSENSYLIKLFREYPKIRSLKNDIPIKQALARCWVLVGIAPDRYPKGIELTVLIDFVTKSYPGHVAPEIITAFEMAIKRQFSDVDYDKLLKHYGTFSCEYLGRIMAVYNDQHRAEVMRQHTNKQPNYKQPEFDKYAGWEMGFFSYYDKYRETGKFTMLVDSAAHHYDQLVEIELITSTKEERHEWGARARHLTPKLARKRIGDSEESEADHNKRIIKKAKALMLEDWFKSESFAGTDIRSLITALLFDGETKNKEV